MHSDKLNRWLTLGTNVSVLVGIFLLIVEINQNNELVRTQIEQARSDAFVLWQREIASGDHVAALFAKLTAIDEDWRNIDSTHLDPVEMERFGAVASARFYDYENMYAQYERGFVSEEYWHGRIAPAIRLWAPIWADQYTDDQWITRQGFKDEIDRIMEEQN